MIEIQNWCYVYGYQSAYKLLWMHNTHVRGAPHTEHYLERAATFYPQLAATYYAGAIKFD